MDLESRIDVRPARRRDLTPVTDIEAASFGRHAWPEQAFVELFDKCPELFFIARTSRRIAGYSIACVERSRAELISIAVRPEFRGRGVARALIEETIAIVQQHGIVAMRLMVELGNDDAIALYRRLGFVRLRTVPNYYGNGRNGWRMELLLRRRGR